MEKLLINIDTNGDGIADLNVDANGDGKPDENVDTNNNGTPDKNVVDINGNAHNGIGIKEETAQSSDDSEIQNLVLEDSLSDKLKNFATSVASINKNGKKGAGIGTSLTLAGLGAAAVGAGVLTKKNKEKTLLVEGDDEDDEEGDDFEDESLEEISTENVKSKKSNWLFGLGVGMAGAGLATGLIAKNKDDDEDNDMLDFDNIDED